MCIWKQVKDVLLETDKPLSPEAIMERTGLKYDQVIGAIMQMKHEERYYTKYRVQTVPVLGNMSRSMYRVEKVMD